MHIQFYCDLNVSECWRGKEEKIKRKVRRNRMMPNVYIVALSQGDQNHLEFFSGILLKQHVFDSAEIFAVGIADGYDEALYMVEAIAGKVYEETGETDIRRYILARQKEFEETGR